MKVVRISHAACSTHHLAFDMGFRHALPEQLETSLSKCDDLALVLVKLAVGLGDTLSDAQYQAADDVRLPDESDEVLVLRLDQLQQRPDGNMLERGVSALQEAAEVPVDAFARLCPVLREDGIVAHWQVEKKISTHHFDSWT